MIDPWAYYSCAIRGHQWCWYATTTTMQPAVPNGARCIRCGEYKR